MDQVQQHPAESGNDFAQRVLELVSMGWFTVPHDLQMEIAVHRFFSGLHNRAARDSIREHQALGTITWAEALRLAHAREVSTTVDPKPAAVTVGRPSREENDRENIDHMNFPHMQFENKFSEKETSSDRTENDRSLEKPVGSSTPDQNRFGESETERNDFLSYRGRTRRKSPSRKTRNSHNEYQGNTSENTQNSRSN